MPVCEAALSSAAGGESPRAPRVRRRRSIHNPGTQLKVRSAVELFLDAFEWSPRMKLEGTDASRRLIVGGLTTGLVAARSSQAAILASGGRQPSPLRARAGCCVRLSAGGGAGCEGSRGTRRAQSGD